MTTLQSAIDKLQEDLDWRSPSGRSQHYCLIDRAQAEAVLRALSDKAGLMANLLDVAEKYKALFDGLAPVVFAAMPADDPRVMAIRELHERSSKAAERSLAAVRLTLDVASPPPKAEQN